MKIKSKDIKMLLLAVGFVAAILSHVLVHQPCEDRILILEGEVETLSVERDRLKEIELIKDVLLLETEESQIIVENELMKYPEDILPETFTMYADNLRHDLAIEIDGVNISVPSLLSRMDIIRLIDDDDQEIPIASYLTTLSFGMTFSYAQLKSFIEYVRSDEYRTVLNTVNISYDASTGQLSGNAIIYKYFIVTPSYVFEPAEIPLVATGNNNPFGTLVSGQAIPEA